MTFMYNPGDPKAIDAGCQCPILDNAHGRGRGGDGFRFGWVVNYDCPLHSKWPEGWSGGKPQDVADESSARQHVGLDDCLL